MAQRVLNTRNLTSTAACAGLCSQTYDFFGLRQYITGPTSILLPVHSPFRAQANEMHDFIRSSIARCEIRTPVSPQWMTIRTSVHNPIVKAFRGAVSEISLTKPCFFWSVWLCFQFNNLDTQLVLAILGQDCTLVVIFLELPRGKKWLTTNPKTEIQHA